MAELVLESSHELYYDNKNHISIPDLIKALNELNGIARQLPAVLEAIYDIKVENSTVLISKVEVGSLLQDFLIALNFGSKEEMEKAVHKLGKDHPMLKNVVTVLLAGLVIWGLLEATGRGGGDTTSLEANNNVIINIGAGEVEMTPEGLKAILDSAIKDKDAVARAALNVVAPAKSDPDATLRFGGPDDKTDLRISAESIKETPGTLQEIHETREAHIDNAIISVRAIDLDNRTKGWFGLINGVKDRLPIALDPSIDAERIHGTIYADIILMYERKSTSEPFKPVKIVIKRMGSSDLPVGAIPVVRNPSLDLTAATPSPQHPQQPTLFE